MEGQVDHETRHSRTLEAIKMGHEAEAAYACANLGKTLAVLWEHQSEGVWSGLTANYLRVYTRSPHDLHNHITPATIEAYDAHGLWASVQPKV
jgi:tRNA A37 methylthiotransferase MiaB